MTRITTVEELDALPDYSPVRIHIVGTNQWLESQISEPGEKRHGR